jgi:carbon storage regulator
MLIISRRLGERIRIADSIFVTVVQVDRGRVRLGIEAPPQVQVVRQELEPHVPSQPAGPGEERTWPGSGTDLRPGLKKPSTEERTL